MIDMMEIVACRKTGDLLQKVDKCECQWDRDGNPEPRSMFEVVKARPRTSHRRAGDIVILAHSRVAL